MDRGAENELPPPCAAEFDRLVSESRAWLAARGETIVSSGSFQADWIRGSIHSDFGPPGQEKRVNQDYALAWLPTATDSLQPRLVVALSDGLTNSYRSECAAALACWVSVRALIEAVSAASPQDRALSAFNEAARALGAMGDQLARDPEGSCPEGQFLSTWKYILKKGGLFQTTLTLAWLDGVGQVANLPAARQTGNLPAARQIGNLPHFHLAIVGDGGALLRRYDDPLPSPSGRGAGGEDWAASAVGRPRDHILAACNLESQQVHALGPAERHVDDFDCWREEELDGPFVCALFTDGVGRGIGKKPFTLLDDLQDLHAANTENAARRFIEKAIRERPKEFDDNLTLAVIRG